MKRKLAITYSESYLEEEEASLPFENKVELNTRVVSETSPIPPGH